jgi:hypothetical protein
MITQVTLTPQQYDIVWDDLDLGEQPYPVAGPRHGRTVEERALLRNRVYGELTARRLAEGPRLDQDLADALTLMARAGQSLDMIWLPEIDAPAMRTVLAVSAGETGLLAERTSEGLRLWAVRGPAVVAALLDLLPPVGAAPGRSITVPTEALRPRQDEQQEDSIYQAARPGGSTTTQQLRSLESLFARPRLRGGQIVANVLDRHGRRTRSRPLEWFDTEDGRCMAQTGAGADGRQHLLVAPADNARIATRVRDMLEALTAAG